MKRQNGWKVYLYGKHIDTVFFSLGCDIRYVYDSLVNHDGYNTAIKLRLEK